jgi:hypothetical protein
LLDPFLIESFLDDLTDALAGLLGSLMGRPLPDGALTGLLGTLTFGGFGVVVGGLGAGGFGVVVGGLGVGAGGLAFGSAVGFGGFVFGAGSAVGSELGLGAEVAGGLELDEEPELVPPEPEESLEPERPDSAER